MIVGFTSKGTMGLVEPAPILHPLHAKRGWAVKKFMLPMATEYSRCTLIWDVSLILLRASVPGLSTWTLWIQTNM